MSFSTEPQGGRPEGTAGPAGASFPMADTFWGKMVHHAWGTLVGAGVAEIALGVIILAWPRASLVVVGVLFAIYLLISGVLQLAGAFGVFVSGSMRVLHFVSGALSILLGLLALRSAAESIFLLALWIGFSWLMRGILLTASGIEGVGLPARGWQIFLGVITALAGIVLIVSPIASIAALTIFAGVWLVIVGITEVVYGISLRAHAKKAAAAA